MRSPSRADPRAVEGRASTRVDSFAGSDRGSVSAEFAAALPAVLVVLALCLAAVQLGLHQMQVQDAAAVAARVTARGDGGSVGGYIAQLVPGGSLAVTVRGDLVCATVSGGPASGPFRAIRMSATSCAPGTEP